MPLNQKHSLAATLAYLPGQIMTGRTFTYTIGQTNTGTNFVENRASATLQMERA